MRVGTMNHPAKDVVQEIRWIAEHGFDFIDLTFEPPAADPSLLDVEQIRRELDHYRLGVVAHTAYYLNYAVPFGSVRDACREEFLRALWAAHEVGAAVMTIHFSRPPRFFSEDQIVEWHREVLEPICEQADEWRMQVALEQIPFPHCNQVEIIEKLLDAMPSLGFHLDSGHTQLEGKGDLWHDYLERFGSRLCHVHLSENDGTSDQHLPLGAVPHSGIDWPQRIAQLKAIPYDGTITLEVFSPNAEYLLQSRDLLRRWWNE
jgi:sugar phosphate isomerase/epimerase